MSGGHYVCTADVCRCSGTDGSCDCRTLSLAEPVPIKTCLDCGYQCLRICINCGCSQERACEGGCAWSVDPEYCTRCYNPDVELAEPFELEFADTEPPPPGAE